MRTTEFQGGLNFVSDRGERKNKKKTKTGCGKNFDGIPGDRVSENEYPQQGGRMDYFWKSPLLYVIKFTNKLTGTVPVKCSRTFKIASYKLNQK